MEYTSKSRNKRKSTTKRNSKKRKSLLHRWTLPIVIPAAAVTGTALYKSRLVQDYLHSRASHTIATKNAPALQERLAALQERLDQIKFHEAMMAYAAQNQNVQQSRSDLKRIAGQFAPYLKDHALAREDLFQELALLPLNNASANYNDMMAIIA